MNKLYLHQFLTRTGAFKTKGDVYKAIRKGEITVDGKTVVNPLYQLRPGRKRVFWNGMPLEFRREIVCLLLNKPEGYVSSRLTGRQKALGKKSIFELVRRAVGKGVLNTLFCVGRLDEGTSGLILLTNDGGLCSRLTDPAFGVEKVYSVVLEKPIGLEDRRRVERGVVIELEEDGRKKYYRTRECRIMSDGLGGRRLKIAVKEGKKREIRRIFQAVGNRVVGLERVAIGGLLLEDLGLRKGGHVFLDRSFLEERAFCSSAGSRR